MASRRTDAKTQVEKWAKLIEPYFDKNMTLSFANKFNFPNVYISRVEIAKTTGMLNAPDKRVGEDGKAYTPPVMQVITNAGVLLFIIEGTRVAPLANGIRFITGINEVDLRITE
jgi:hypothetical protein